MPMSPAGLPPDFADFFLWLSGHRLNHLKVNTEGIIGDVEWLDKGTAGG